MVVREELYLQVSFCTLLNDPRDLLYQFLQPPQSATRLDEPYLGQRHRENWIM